MAAASEDRCLETVDDYKKQKFREFEYRKELDENEFTSIWKNPERLIEKDDFCLIFHLLSQRIREGNYEETLIALKMLSEPNQKEDVSGPISEMFSCLMLQILREERRKKIDSHIILEWLEVGDRFLPEQDIFSKKSFAALKLYFLCKSWKSKYDCSSCGCIQKMIIDLYIENNCSRLNEALLTIIKTQDSEFHPTLRRMFKSDLRPIELFSFFLEILQELDTCNVIGISDEKAPARLIQLIGLLCEINTEDVPVASSQLYRLLSRNGNSERKSSAAIEAVVRSRLLPKIFESISNSTSLKIDNFNRNSSRTFVDLIEKEEYSFTAQILFAPLQLLNHLFENRNVWQKARPVVTSRMESLNLGSPQAPVLLLYFLSFVHKSDPSLIEPFTKSLERKFSKAPTEQKNTILLILEILEQLGASNEAIAAYLKTNRVKASLLLATSNVDLVLPHLSDLTPHEFDHFLQSKSSSFSDESWNDLFRSINNRTVYVGCDEVWAYAVERKSSDPDAIKFIGSQLKGLVEKKDKKNLMQRVGQVFKQLRIVSSSSKLPPRDLLLAFPEFLLSFSSEEYSRLPQNTTSSLIPVLILGYCFFFDQCDARITSLFRSFLAKIRLTGNVLSDDNPIQVLEDVCEVIRIGKTPNCDISFMRQSKSGGVETFIKTLADVIIMDSLRQVYPSAESLVRIKERIADVSSVLLGRLAPQLLVLGDRGPAPFCQLALIVDKFLTSSKSIRRICERSIDGYVCMTEKWNGLFVVPRVLKILTSIQNQSDLGPLLMQLLEKIRKNEVLLSQLEKKKEFIQFERV